MMIETTPGVAPWAARMERLVGRRGEGVHGGAVAAGENLMATSKRWKAELAAAKGRKSEAKPASEPEAPEPDPDYVPGTYAKQAEEMSAMLIAAKRAKALTLKVAGAEAGTHRLPVFRA